MQTTVEAHYSPNQGGASLLISIPLKTKTTLIIGGGSLAAARANAVLQAESRVLVITIPAKSTSIPENANTATQKSNVGAVCDELRVRSNRGELEIVDLEDESHLESLLDQRGDDINFAFITDTLIGDPRRRDFASAVLLCKNLKRRKILVNVADMPSLCDFILPASHRFPIFSPSKSCQMPPKHSESLSTPQPPSLSPSEQVMSSLQIAVTTSGKGCRMAGRIRREIISKLPAAIGDAVENIAKLREVAKNISLSVTESIKSPPKDSQSTKLQNSKPSEDPTADNEDSQPASPNEPVQQLSTLNRQEEESEAQLRRMRWVAQISEYWPLERLATLDMQEAEQMLRGPINIDNYGNSDSQNKPASQLGAGSPDTLSNPKSQHNLTITPNYPKGRIYLLGSGPGHPGLLTVAAHDILTRKATLVLSDKLVPSEVLALIPDTTKVKIAKKFPGNNDGAQNELMLEAVEAASKGEIVVRLKQGDPMVYGRAGEEILYCRQRGFEPIVVPGVSSAIAGPTFATIPVTQRGVAESMIMCTGVGRQGKPTKLPGYVRSQTLVLLMGVARLDSLLETLTQEDKEGGAAAYRSAAAYPPYLPIAIIERASMPDQRVIAGTLSTISAALVSVGDQRPPGMIVVGWSVLALVGEGDVTVLDDANSAGENVQELEQKDRLRVERWLHGAGWRVQEGFASLE